jgi:hypothetical protein
MRYGVSDMRWSGHAPQIHLPSGGDHGVLEVGHEPPRGIHPTRARPWLAGVVSAKDIEQGIPFGGPSCDTMRPRSPWNGWWGIWRVGGGW